MKKSEMFTLILDKVCEVCEVRKESVLKGSKYQAVVDARSLCVQYCRRIGLSCDEIALIVLRLNANDMEYLPQYEEVHKKAKGIDHIFKSYSDRCLQSMSYCLMSKEVAQWCSEVFEK